MNLAPWRPLVARALHRNRAQAESRYLQLATVRGSGQPANRTVVFRGFLEDSDCLQFAVDRRSEKIHQLEACPWGEVCWYFTKTREQFRVLGRLTLVDRDTAEPPLAAARDALWQNLSGSARKQFAWPHPQHERARKAAFEPPQPDPNQPLPQFCLLLLAPETVDHLELQGDPQNRCIYELKQTWMSRAVNP
ncbi:pyridoxamine 5'-phosphate oxidase family protein [Romeria aff. gracilis LEGE 07310]|uniref:Pyridoxamine 5'-phosphate oxidase family protein n=1 Tax=Vasconcelosia minhoensis LEGE 07310 TaxID=915328 RepID=A0A8J7AQ14_9CYAN|nr:Npun_F5749 family FMN-dependent PPOX-type flavoprotein [Romeria gracilis]MBE9079110.1 pyridoxamine 5'-phosphate oxidase family protein [Romeria aff. gracilis LEGE 07310]